MVSLFTKLIYQLYQETLLIDSLVFVAGYKCEALSITPICDIALKIHGRRIRGFMGKLTVNFTKFKATFDRFKENTHYDNNRSV